MGNWDREITAPSSQKSTPLLGWIFAWLRIIFDVH